MGLKRLNRHLTPKITNFWTIWGTSMVHKSAHCWATFNNQGSQEMLRSGEVGKPLGKQFDWSSPVLWALNWRKWQYFQWTGHCLELPLIDMCMKIGYFCLNTSALKRQIHCGVKLEYWLISVEARAILVRVIQNLVVVPNRQYFFPWPGHTFGSAMQAAVGIFEIFWARWKRKWKI